ncbi:hypothetical protein Ancab_022322 [Ancistrocladus abbreviatus]
MHTTLHPTTPVSNLNINNHSIRIFLFSQHSANSCSSKSTNTLRASMNMKIALTIAIISTLCAESMAQSSSSCTTALVTMSPCLNYISGNESRPSSSCCSQLASVVNSQPECLCQVINGGGSSLGLSINRTQALKLPSACNVQTPSVSRCSASSPTGSTAAGSTPSTTSSGNGSKTVPSTNVESSDGNSSKSELPLSFALLFFALYALPSIVVFV